MAAEPTPAVHKPGSEIWREKLLLVNMIGQILPVTAMERSIDTILIPNKPSLESIAITTKCIMMRFLFIALFLPGFVYSQKNYIKITGFKDQKTIEKIEKNTQPKGKRALIYQPAIEAEYSSLLIIQDAKDIAYWMIRHDSIVRKGKLESDKIFLYKDFLKTGATAKEDKLKFVPPLIGGKETELVIYQDAQRKFYFEYGKNVTGYSPLPELEKYRKEWLAIIRNELQSLALSK